MHVQPPADETELFRRADGLAGHTLRDVATVLGVAVPTVAARSKGWIGQLLEAALGASAGSKADPDFPALGVELKTLPVDARGKPLESTWVCHCPVDGSLERTWEASWVRRKLARVLWVPVLTVRGQPIGDRRLGAPLLWSPSPEEEGALRLDWTELTDMVARGEHWQLSARHGKVLQIRPKGATGADLTWAIDGEGDWVRINPRGFYLRPHFTAALLARHFRL